ncbi:MAG: type I methionyl aminopeptidase [Deltaproteobacteria bacterium RBG_19FT_COMBO_60_16]|nr:MAG: type I methionyl aminopeptidase [Deltaproteobacteria bacterium RBG_16_64_85]OGP99837.1 MAG: type I methionyl aminopeptidase [Deltaproteobacteria bacterium RBG_19FT_COMBO_60_16]
MIIIKSPQEIEAMRRAGAIVGQFFEEVKSMIRPGSTTFALEEFAEEFVQRHGVKGAFKGYLGYPAILCTSINEEVVHGIPSRKRILREGDIVSIDFGVVRDVYCGDAARTYAVGSIPETSMKLMRATEVALERAIEASHPGNRVGDISAAVQETAEGAGFSVVRDFVGHGIGRMLHEEPQVPNFGVRGTGPRLTSGMVLAIEPMVNEGGYEVEVLPDGWTVVTRDRKRSAHFEHMVAVTEEGGKILSLP